jgi:hypothetical protein
MPSPKCDNILYALHFGHMSSHSKYFQDLEDPALCSKEAGRVAFADVKPFGFTPADLTPFLALTHGW